MLHVINALCHCALCVFNAAALPASMPALTLAQVSSGMLYTPVRFLQSAAFFMAMAVVMPMSTMMSVSAVIAPPLSAPAVTAAAAASP